MPPMTIGYTIFNKALLVPKIIFGLKKSFSSNDEFLFYIDNCEDGSLDRLMELEQYLPSKPKYFQSDSDVYEIKANNKLLKEATNDIVVLFQDDIIANDEDMKHKISNMVDAYGDDLGLLGGRSGFELDGKRDFPERPLLKVSNWEHKQNQYKDILPEAGFAERTILNRGPIVFTRRLLDDVGYLNEEYYPLWGDDMDYCCRAKFLHGKKNVVFQCGVESNLKWGAMHTGQSKVNMRKVIPDNWNHFIDTWGETLTKYYEDITKL